MASRNENHEHSEAPPCLSAPQSDGHLGQEVSSQYEPPRQLSTEATVCLHHCHNPLRSYGDSNKMEQQDSVDQGMDDGGEVHGRDYYSSTTQGAQSANSANSTGFPAVQPGQGVRNTANTSATSAPPAHAPATALIIFHPNVAQWQATYRDPSLLVGSYARDKEPWLELITRAWEDCERANGRNAMCL